MPQGSPLIVKLRALYYAVTLTRFNIFILIAGFALLFVDQGQDLLVEIDEDPNAYWWLIGGGLLWAWNIWYWARVLLDIRFPEPPVRQADLAWWRNHLPRILGLSAFAALGWNLYRATGFTWHVFVVVAAGAFFYLWVLFRRPIRRWLAKRHKPDNPKASILWIDPIDNERETVHPRWQDDIKEIWSKTAVKITLLFGVIMFLWGMISPLSMGLTFNTLVLLFTWGATFLPLGSVITYIGSRKGLPLFGMLLLMAVVFSHTNDNHAIRQLASKPQIRPNIEAGLDQWIEKNHCDKNTCPPLVIVATAGGGIRAAYWTGTVLGDLDDELAKHRDAPLRENLFAISGVSGGSVGATVYRATIEAGVPQGKIMDSVQQVLAQDFLTPLSAGLLYPDLVQRFLPYPWLEDRATVFEQGLEAGFENIVGKPTMEQSFIGLTAGGGEPWPALFLNSTWSDNGRRIVAAGYEIPANQRLYADLIDRLGYDMRLSTAAHNSARFPFASPPGSWQLALSNGKRIRQRLQDGGLFENFGAETALEILQVARKHFKQKGVPFNPLVILISSDPSLPKDFSEPEINPPIEFGYEALTTFRTYGAVRVGRGDEAAAQLKDWNRDPKHFAYFRMCDNHNGSNPPLGWALSQSAQSDIKGYLIGPDGPTAPPCRQDNQESLDRVLKILAGK